MKSKYLGFSLLELLTAVSIVGIIVAIALPAYRSTIDRSNRIDATTDLMDIAQRLQRCFTTFGRFNPPNNACTVFQQVTSADGVDTRKGFYTIRYFDDGDNANDATTYEIRATPIAGQSQEDDNECQVIAVNERGVTTAFDANNVDSTDRCWR